MSLDDLSETIDENIYTECLVDIWYFLDNTIKERPIGTSIGELWALLVGVKPGIAASEVNAHFLKSRLNNVEDFDIEIAVCSNAEKTNSGHFLLVSRKLLAARLRAENKLANFCHLTSLDDLDTLLAAYKDDPKATHDDQCLQLGFILGFPASALYAMARKLEIYRRYPGKHLATPPESSVVKETKEIFSRSMPVGERYKLLERRMIMDSIIQTNEITNFFMKQGFTHEEARFLASERAMTIITPLKDSTVMQFLTCDYPNSQWGSAAKDIYILEKKLREAGREKHCLI